MPSRWAKDNNPRLRVTWVHIFQLYSFLKSAYLDNQILILIAKVLSSTYIKKVTKDPSDRIKVI